MIFVVYYYTYIIIEKPMYYEGFGSWKLYSSFDTFVYYYYIIFSLFVCVLLVFVFADNL